MCKPSAHLIEYIENQNIEVRSIIKDLPDELPLTEIEENETELENNLSNEVNPQEEVNNKKEEAVNNQPTPEVQQNVVPAVTEAPPQENPVPKEVPVVQGQVSEPVINNGDVQLAAPVVNSVVDNKVAVPMQTTVNNAFQAVATNPLPNVAKLEE